MSPSLGWAGKAVLEFRCLTGDWAGALALLEAQQARARQGELSPPARGDAHSARARQPRRRDRDNAKAYALEAAKLAPTLVPAAALAGRMLAEGGELRRAARIINKAWQANPHPDLAQVFADLRFGDAARDRLKRIEALAKKAPGHIEGALALARAAIDAREYGKARAALASYLAAPTKRVALLMAELERAAANDEGRAREWIARALNAAPDPTWTADGHVSDRWLPVSPKRPAGCFRMARSADRHRERGEYGAGDRAGIARPRATDNERATGRRRPEGEGDVESGSAGAHGRARRCAAATRQRARPAEARSRDTARACAG